MAKPIPIFRDWAPEWLIKVILFSLLLPSIVLFFLPLANINAAAGYYGSEPADIQFAVALFYAGYVGFYILERRFFAYLATREYFILFTFLQMLTSLICYYTHEVYILFPIRFIQGMLFSSTVNLSLALMFTRLHTERAREVSFSVFFGLLLCAMPFNNFVTADLIDSYNFNIVYKGALFSYLPCLVLLLMVMNNVRLNVRFPLYKLDWQSFAMYSTVLCLIGYILIYGQEYYWLEDLRIRYSVLAIVGLTAVYLLRQKAMKRPYTDLRIFRFRNFKIGLLVLFVMYICRFASGITNSFFATVLGFDPMHVSYINLLNLSGLVVGVVIACAIILQKKRIRYIWLPGFLLLLIFHVSMFFLFDVQANEYNYFIPLFIQGLGVGLIMVPTIVYAVSAVPVSLGASAAAICLAIRYLGFCVSIGIINYFELFERSRHYNAFQDHLTRIDPAVRLFLKKQTTRLMAKGMSHGQAARASHKLLVRSINGQGQLRFAMDYYEMMSWLIVGTLLLIAIFPYLNRTTAYLRSRKLTPA
ncbi:beta-carotene 15,15'-monooxygenase [Chitinophaga polysaccharea]|uniref:MFS transporter n=1 Tax=Chitinophaga TaxID=79328 RepID=UPI0014550DDE|nr:MULTISPECIES: MFS transporter [Chitinophaga]NLR61779.1 beta-carotene 15,15'-monooxygenase [Chitinophaga polysaccharea]NLU92637.1 beta-carotene 15,15'-monooxygenase [Chitinophaga sp. Ak27]